MFAYWAWKWKFSWSKSVEFCSAFFFPFFPRFVEIFSRVAIYYRVQRIVLVDQDEIKARKAFVPSAFFNHICEFSGDVKWEQTLFLLREKFDESLGLLIYYLFLFFRTRVKFVCDIKMQYSHHCEHLLERLNKQREAGFLCDCTIVIGEFQFKAHRNVLASFSEYFGAIYRSTSENNVFLDQSQVKADGFQKLLEFIYTGTLNLDR